MVHECTSRQFALRLKGVKGLKLKDPWGSECRMGWIDYEGRSVWVWYEGLPVPFERCFFELLDAVNGRLRSDLDRQWVKRLEPAHGPAIEFEYFPALK